MTDADVERVTRSHWGQVIENQRKSHKLTQAELGRLFDPPVTQSTVARWESGGSEPRIRHKIQLGRIFNVPASLLFPLMDVAA